MAKCKPKIDHLITAVNENGHVYEHFREYIEHAPKILGGVHKECK